MRLIPDKRSIYFLFDRLSFGKREQNAVLILLSLLILVELSALLIPYLLPKSESNYEKINALVAQKVALMQAKEDSILKYQYLPTQESLAELEQKKSSREKKVKRNFEINPILLNEATISELESLPGIGPKMAQLIVDYRIKNGEFSTIDELKKVKGIGAKKLEKLKPFLKLN